MLEVENLAGKETGSVPEHAFKYPYSDPASKGNTKKSQPLYLAAGKKACAGRNPSYQLVPFSFEEKLFVLCLSESLLPLLRVIFLAYCVPL